MIDDFSCLLKYDFFINLTYQYFLITIFSKWISFFSIGPSLCILPRSRYWWIQSCQECYFENCNVLFKLYIYISLKFKWRNRRSLKHNRGGRTTQGITWNKRLERSKAKSTGWSILKCSSLGSWPRRRSQWHKWCLV